MYVVCNQQWEFYSCATLKGLSSCQTNAEIISKAALEKGRKDAVEHNSYYGLSGALGYNYQLDLKQPNSLILCLQRGTNLFDKSSQSYITNPADTSSYGQAVLLHQSLGDSDYFSKDGRKRRPGVWKC